tara:strand:+ start:368 stop:610 length:243 start_codon:yes stop_codon:yes gene_type:complete
MKKTYVLNGGGSYVGGIEIEADSMESASHEWYARYASNGQYKVDGFLYPVFGSDIELDDYAVIDFDTLETLTRSEVMEGR